MPRIVIDLPEEDLRQLDNLKAIRRVARAEIIRQALAGYLENNRADGNNNAFGLWKDQNIDGVDYENQLREEWE
ncbi:ribbon-helix-helix domain-containing protein [Brenneria tiliae]|uniref:Ribbon-helix-helix protein, CopG family n=1 Tax=Brenneria tiliae TaxID=2914984 RepID=A0ABT0MUD8_9GAMM|nr:ribbon-helix-helix protein, CopG family [Brenneria tiliae]MCL2892819.1 ribbon-helix-helix protein, CopG family [Brenneria tiliae]MCL2898038.1 ribbon-helix-helix protein, CopG family [Brenneria tiliae]MCL2902119.1 ribbon-helix-helix protein, CopG family [Brenneria tiliae]